MSKRSRRRISKSASNNSISSTEVATIVRREIERSNMPKAAQTANPANFQPIPQSIINKMYMNLGPQKNAQDYFAPGAPIRPIPGITPPEGPRQFEYLVNYNATQVPRSTEQYRFGELRSLATLCYGIQLAEQALLDYVTRLELLVEPRPELLDEDLDASRFDADIQEYKDFFAFPDKERDLKAWLRMAVRDILEIDALAIYVHPNRAGGVYALEIVDGATVKPLIDDRGRRPASDFPAYQQFLYGVPVVELTSDELLYLKETERAESVYGMSRVEKIMMIINQALRKQTKDLMHFTDGTLPAGFVQVPVDSSWNQDQIEGYEAQLNNLLAGNDQQRARIHILPKGMEYEPTDPPDINIDFDRWLLNVIAACFGLTLAELAITESVNKSSGDSQENVVYRRALGPLMARLADLFTYILKKYFNEDRFIVRFKGFEEAEDFNALATAYSTLVTSGIQSPTQAARAMHLPVYNDVDIPPFTVTKSGPVMLEDLADPQMRQAQKDAQMAGLQMAIKNPGAKPSQDQPDDQEQPSDDDDSTSGSQDEKPPKTTQDANNRYASLSARDRQIAMSTGPDLERAMSLEYRRWRDVVLNDVKAGKPIRKFESELIPTSTLAMGHIGLQQCRAPDDVKQFFQAMKEQVYA